MACTRVGVLLHASVSRRTKGEVFLIENLKREREEKTYVGGYFVCGVDRRLMAVTDPSRGVTTTCVVVGELDGGAATTITGFISCLLVDGFKYCPPIMGMDPDLSSPILFVNQQNHIKLN